MLLGSLLHNANEMEKIIDVHRSTMKELPKPCDEPVKAIAS